MRKRLSDIVKGFVPRRTLAGIATAGLFYACTIGFVAMASAGAEAEYQTNVLWQRQYEQFENIADLQSTSDSNFVAITPKSTDADLHFAKFSPEGEILWEQSLGASGTRHVGNSIRETNDGGYIVAGYKKTFPPPGENISDYDILLVKTDVAGEIQWDKTYGVAGYGPSGDDRGRTIEQTSDGGYVIGGKTAGGSPAGFYILKTDSEGNVQWDRSFAPTENIDDDGGFAFQTQDGGYIIFSYTDIVKLDSEGGTVQWQKQAEHKISQVTPTSDGGYLYLDNEDPEPMTRINAAGNIQWTRSIRDYPLGNVFVPKEANDGGFNLGGSLVLTGDLGNVLKTDSQGNLTWSVFLEVEALIRTATIYGLTELDSNSYLVSGLVGKNIYHPDPPIGYMARFQVQQTSSAPSSARYD